MLYSLILHSVYAAVHFTKVFWVLGSSNNSVLTIPYPSHVIERVPSSVLLRIGEKWTTPTLLSVKLWTKNMKRQDKKRTCQMGGRLAKQAPRTSSKPRQEGVNNNHNREKTNPKQTRSPADDAACRKPAIGKHVVDVPADWNVFWNWVAPKQQ